MHRNVFTIVVLSAALAGAASAHNHVTVDTTGGAAGDRITIRAGYYPAESAYSIDSGGRLLLNGAPAVYSVTEPLSQSGPLSGWIAGDEILLTSDFYFATGRLDGGEFKYELAGIAALSGGPGVIAWGEFGTGGFVAAATSDASTRALRSFDVGVAGHNHEQGCAFSAPGLYDVTLIAWDGNGRYADSNPITVRFDVVPAPPAAALALAAIPASLSRRRR